MSKIKFKNGDVIVCGKQSNISDTNFLYGQIGLVENSRSGVVNLKCADNDFDDWVSYKLFDEKEIIKIGEL
jgi:hypothetical protein